MSQGKILDSIIDAVGMTPMVRLSRFGRDLPCELLAKCEFLNPGGSLKDRIGVRMIEDAESEGRIAAGDTLIEPTSGNTGIGLAMAAAVKGYRTIVTMPEKMSQEKQVVLEALGAEIIRTPTEAPWDSPESHISVARRLHDVLPRSHILDQYSNPSNPLAHEEGTAREILDQCDGRLDAVVIGAGTGGTITGVARALKAAAPDVSVVGADPVGSILAGPEEVRSYKVEGIGYDFVPGVLERDLVDRWIKTDDRESFLTARRLIRQEGLLVGGSSGAAAWAAEQVCRDMRPGQRVVVILPDSIRNYLTKFVDEAWMRRHGFLRAEWEGCSVGDIVGSLPDRGVVVVEVTDRVRDVVGRFKAHGISQVPVVDDGRLAGILTETDLLRRLVDGRAGPDTSVAEVMARAVATIGPGASSSELPGIFERGEAAIIVDEDRRVRAILTKTDLVEFLASRRACTPE